MDNKVKSIALRYAISTLGLFILALGTVFAIKSNLGVGSLTCPQYICAQKWPRFTIGTYNAIVYTIFVLIQYLLLRSRFKVTDLLQLVANLLFGYMIDLGMLIFNRFTADTVAMQWICIALCCVLSAIGISIEIFPNAWKLPAEMTVCAFNTAVGGKFSTVKVIMDCAIVAISLGACQILWGNVFGPEGSPVIGWGTLVCAVAIGLIMKLTDPLVSRLFKNVKI